MGRNCACSCPVSREVGCCGSCGKGLVKVLAIVFSILIIVAGLGVLITRIWLYFNQTYVTNALEEVKVVYDDATHTYTFMWVLFYVGFLVALGIYLIVVGAFGLSFAFKQTLQLYLLTLIGSVFVLLICASIGVGLPVCTAIDERNDGEVGILFDRYAATKNFTYRAGSSGVFWNATDLVQSEEKCCGFKGPDDYTQSGFVSKYDGLSYPFSCCALRFGRQPSPFVQLNDVDWERCERGRALHFRTGCGEKLRNATDLLGTPGLEIIKYTYGASIAVAVILAIGILFTVLLYLNPN